MGGGMGLGVGGALGGASIIQSWCFFFFLSGGGGEYGRLTLGAKN